MNLHLNRRLEVLAREIAEAKKPRINTEESRLFAEVAKQPYAKTLGDLKSKGAALETDRPSGAAHEQSSAEVANAAPPSTEPGVKFKVGDWVQWTAEVMRFNNFSENEKWVVTRIEDGKLYASDGTYELPENIEPAPSPDAEGWIPHRPGDRCPVERDVVVAVKGDWTGEDPRPSLAKDWDWAGACWKIHAYKVIA